MAVSRRGMSWLGCGARRAVVRSVSRAGHALLALASSVVFVVSGAVAGCGREAMEPPAGTLAAVHAPSGTGGVAETPRHGSGASSDPTSLDVDAKTTAPTLAVFDFVALRELERAGFGFAPMALGLQGAPTNAEASSDPGYASIVAVLSRDLDELARKDGAAGVGMKYAHRVFDKRWLTSAKFGYELAAVVHRVDRRVFAPGTCGELRFVYRLGYRSEIGGQPVSSRVPMTVNVVRWINEEGCARWLAAMTKAGIGEGEGAADRWMASDAPLGPDVFAMTSLASVEVNLQSVRWPSTVRPNMAGHAEYLLRVFRRATSGRFEPALLENTPDVERLAGNPRLAAELAQWLRAQEQQQAITLGTVRVPDQFLATRAVSVAPHGLARKANRPFSALFAAAWADDDEAARILRRLDGLSCPGCHQSRSVAGFHVLGNLAPDKRWDTLVIPHSPHFTDDMPRRHEYVMALMEGRPPDEYRAPAEHPNGAGGWGSRCGVDGRGAAFADWKCADGFTCRQVDDPDVGECLPTLPVVGAACETGITSWGAAGRDSTRLGAPRSCGDEGVCERNAVGFPGGMCSASCPAPGEPNDVCGAIAVLDSFNACIARGEIFETCLATTTRPGALRRCSHDAPCRDDYVCAATPSGEGACLPPYFLFQLRVDGHVF